MGSCRLTYEDMMSHPEVWGKELPKWATELAKKAIKGFVL